MPAPTCIITLIKRFGYRGNANEEWSNRYMFDGATPSGPTVWHDLFMEVAALERAIISVNANIVRAYGHISTDPHAASVWSETLASPLGGLMAPGTGIRVTGDDAVYVSMITARRNTKGKPVYLRKYYHDAFRSQTDPDGVAPPQLAGLNALGTVMTTGLTSSARHLVDPLGNPAIGHTAGPYVTTRTLKRRGRRP